MRIPKDLLSQLKRTNIFPSDIVFYINSKCNLRCMHCYVGNQLLNQNKYFNYLDAIQFLSSFDYLDRLTILGGEPLLYEHIDVLFNSLDLTKIKELRMTTNLTHIDALKKMSIEVKNKVRVCVSIDGHNSETHEYIRGKGTFNSTIENLKFLINEKYDIELTHTIMSNNIIHFDKFIELCKTIGVKQINLHRMSLQGNALNNHKLQVSPSEYVHFCENLRLLKSISTNNISIRFPVLFANNETYLKLIDSESYQPHSFKSYYGENHRIVIYPTGQIFISSELFGTESYIGTITQEKFIYNNSTNNEIYFFKKTDATISDLNPNQKGDANYPNVLSVSFKETINI